MKTAKGVQILHKTSDERMKEVAKDYMNSSRLLIRYIEKLKIEIADLEPKTPSRAKKENELLIVRQMHRTTYEIGREAKHYYDKGWWRSEAYTLNAR